LIATLNSYPAHLRLAEHAHRSAYFCFVRQGSFTERQGRRAERHDTAACIFRPADDVHANDFPERGAVCVNVEVGPAWLQRMAEIGVGHARFGVRSAVVARIGERLYDELVSPDSLSGLVVDSLAAEIIAAAARARVRSGRRRWLEDARRMIEREFAAPLSLSTIASAVGIHPVHLAREFRASNGCTVGDYLREVRVAFARKHLALTSAPIAEVALAAGFCDQSQLTRTFKLVTGQTPARYRRSKR
jgi:AraC family transcriptional regulator